MEHGDILVTAVIGVVFGLLLVSATYALIVVMAISPVLQWASAGLWFFPSYFVGYTIRRPGAALLVGILIGLVQVPFTPYGISYLVGGMTYGLYSEAGLAIITRYRNWQLPALLLGFVQFPFVFAGFFIVIVGLINGITCELPFLFTRYRCYSLPLLITTGIVNRLVALALALSTLGFANLALGTQVAMVVAATLGGVLAAIIAKTLADALSRTGALDSLASDRVQTREDI